MVFDEVWKGVFVIVDYYLWGMFLGADGLLGLDFFEQSLYVGLD